MTKDSTKRNLLGLIPIILFAILAACMLTVLLSGADSYASITERGNSSYTMRTASQYISMKIKQTNGRIGHETFGGIDTVTLTEKYGEEEFVTRIYCYDGYLCELFSSANAQMSPSDGEKLLRMEKMSVESKEKLLTIIFKNGDNTRTVILSCDERWEEAP